MKLLRGSHVPRGRPSLRALLVGFVAAFIPAATGVVAFATPSASPGAAPSVIALPVWSSTYDSANGDGYAGWERRGLERDADAYGLEPALGGQAGLWIWPRGGREYSPGGAGWSLVAPGTTRIARAAVELSYANKLFAHHCLRVALAAVGGDPLDERTWCKPPSPPASQDHMEVVLRDPSGEPTAKELLVETVVPACDKGA